MPKTTKRPASLQEATEAEKRKQREKIVQAGTIKFLREHGWRVYRMNSGLFPGARGMVRIGEPGMPDVLALRYVVEPVRGGLLRPATGVGYVLWVECKRAKGGKTAENQALWHATESENGALIYVCNDLEDLRDWYYKRFGFLHASENLFLAAGVRG